MLNIISRIPKGSALILASFRGKYADQKKMKNSFYKAPTQPKEILPYSNEKGRPVCMESSEFPWAHVSLAPGAGYGGEREHLVKYTTQFAIF